VPVQKDHGIDVAAGGLKILRQAAADNRDAPEVVAQSGTKTLRQERQGLLNHLVNPVQTQGIVRIGHVTYLSLGKTLLQPPECTARGM
jgi:hypothetical protein